MEDDPKEKLCRFNLKLATGYNQRTFNSRQRRHLESVVRMIGRWGPIFPLPFLSYQPSFALFTTPVTVVQNKTLLFSAGMPGKSLASSMLRFDSATSCFCVPDFAASAPNIVPFSVTFSSRLPQKAIWRLGTSHFSPKKWTIHSTTQIENSAPSNEDGKTWEACRQALFAFNFSKEEENKILGKAFGHVHSPYWGEERKKEVPKFETVNEILDYLRSLGLSNDDLYKLLKKFPEVLGCNIEHELRTNVQILEKDWGIKGKSLKNLLLRNPKVLGYNVDCKGDCMAQCTRCWVRF